MPEVTDVGMDVPVGEPHMQESGLMSIGAVAAHNIAERLKLDPSAVPQIETVIREEINHMSEHFTLLYADITTQHEIEKAKDDGERVQLKNQFDAALAQAIADFNTKVANIRSTHNYVRANWERIAAVAVGLLGLGALLGHFV